MMRAATDLSFLSSASRHLHMPSRRLAVAIALVCIALTGDVHMVRAQETTSTSRADDAAARATAATSRDAAPDTRLQYPAWLADSYVGLRVGYLNNPFSALQLEPGATTGAVRVPPATFAVALFGHEFGRYVAAETTYIRPARFLTYEDVNGTGIDHSVWMAFGTFTVKGRVPVSPRVTLHGDVGLALSSRRGFDLGGAPVVRDDHLRSIVLGAGVDIHRTPHWDIVADVSFIPANEEHRQPRALYLAAGIRYTMRRLPDARLAAAEETNHLFPAHMVQLGIGTGTAYGVSHFVSHTVPIFWGGHVDVGPGVAGDYLQNVFHTPRVFALDIGVRAATWRSRVDRTSFNTFSAYPRLRFMLLHRPLADLYAWYAVAGPTFISQLVVDGQPVGTNHFIFQDAIGVGAFLGRDRHLIVGASVSHFSNGNLETRNPGMRVPLTIDIGYAF
jgi:hypothetical protein